jgi:23S rRNA (cytidine1920-2'-O)/16S rRNA (cytidine1409-2'-O)-methyltransferase
VLLRAGAAEVVAVDVGYGQLAGRCAGPPGARPRPDERPRRDAGAGRRAGDLVVGDLSFISLELVLDAAARVTEPDGDLALMVKPQFEVGKDRLGRGGVVREPALRVEAVEKIVAAADRRGWGAVAGTVSSLPGPAGNVEFFVWLRHGERALRPGSGRRTRGPLPGSVGPDEKVIP